MHQALHQHKPHSARKWGEGHRGHSVDPIWELLSKLGRHHEDPPGIEAATDLRGHDESGIASCAPEENHGVLGTSKEWHHWDYVGPGGRTQVLPTTPQYCGVDEHIQAHLLQTRQLEVQFGQQQVPKRNIQGRGKGPQERNQRGGGWQWASAQDHQDSGWWGWRRQGGQWLSGAIEDQSRLLNERQYIGFAGRQTTTRLDLVWRSVR